VAGACNALRDEYSGFLSPRRLAEIDAELEGKFVGIGIDVMVVPDNKGSKHLIVSKVYPNSPAAQDKQKLSQGDEILSIDGQTPDPRSPGALVAKLRGEAGTKVDLEIGSMMGMPRKLKIERRLVPIPSVDQPEPPEAGIG